MPFANNLVDEGHGVHFNLGYALIIVYGISFVHGSYMGVCCGVTYGGFAFSKEEELS